jgi:hypothetical protein
MKTRFIKILLAAALMTAGVSCSTVYDQYGRPRTVVEPGAAVLGAAAAGLAGYAIARNRDDDHHHHNHYPHRGYHPRYYY